jgi:hypothetical protein
VLNKISLGLKIEILLKCIETELFKLILAFLAFLIAVAFALIRLVGDASPSEIPAMISAVFFIVFVLVLGTLPGKFRRVKESLLAKKFGKNLIGRVMNKRQHKSIPLLGNSPKEKISYLIQFSYEYQGYHEKEMLLEYGELAEKIQIGSTIPIRILTHNPEICTPRLNRWSKDLGIKPQKKGYWAPFRPIPIYSYRPPKEKVPRD